MDGNDDLKTSIPRPGPLRKRVNIIRPFVNQPIGSENVRAYKRVEATPMAGYLLYEL